MKDAGLAAVIHERLAICEIQDIRLYGSVLERLLAAEGQRLHTALDEFSSRLPEDARNEYLENRSEEYQEITEHYPNELRLNLTVSAYSTLEGRMAAIAKTLLRVSAPTPSVSSPPGRLPSQNVQTSIDKISRLGISVPNWDRLDPYRHIRNAVVHNSGIIRKETQEKLRDFLNSSPNIVLDEHQRIVVAADFLNDFLKEMECFYSHLFAAWSSWTESLANSSSR